MSDIIDRIDELVDESLASGEPRIGYSYGDPTYPKCPHCNRHWHGLPLTERIAQMYTYGMYDPAYLCAEDDTPVVCEGSEFIGPRRPTSYEQLRPRTIDCDWQRFSSTRREVAFRVLVEADLEGFRRSMEEVSRRWAESFREMAEAFQSLGTWGLQQSSHWQWESPEPCSEPPEIDVEFGPQNWTLGVEPDAPWHLQRQVADRTRDFEAPSFPVPDSPGFDFSEYNLTEQRGPQPLPLGRSA